MFSRKIPALALFGTSIVASSALGDGMRADRMPDARTILGIDGTVCTQAAGNTVRSNARWLYKIAANQKDKQKNELKPYGTLPQDEQKAQQQPDGTATEDPPLMAELGTHSYRITTRNPLAQRFFDQGLRLAYGFNHAESARAFRMAQKLDPGCAMCFWGEALVLGPNINMPMDPQANGSALAASNKAVALKKQASPREQALIDALALRYSPDPTAERPTLDAAYADAMRTVASRFPNDQDIGVLYAEALMNLSPWDYWEAGGAKPKGRTADLVATLERVLKDNPEHPGAIHYYIHTVEASTDPKRAEPYAERLGKLMPAAGHLVHMPSHIYYRVGRYKDSLAANKQAVAVDEAYIADQKPTGVYPLAYYPHNVHFVLVSAQMAGDGDTAITAADKLAGLVGDDTARAIAIAQPVKVAPYFAHAQFSRPETILAIPRPGDGLPYVEGLWHYARGIAFIGKGNMDSARKEQQAIDQLMTSGEFDNLKTAGIPADDVLQIASNVLNARMAQANGDLDEAVENFEKAAVLEDKLAYMEPPYWYYPVRQSLGAVLLQKGELDAAEQAFRASLARTPNNGWALYGLTQVYKQRGDTQRAAAAQELLDKAWAGSRAQLDLAKL
ncbi:hypothetical protein GCM10027343_15190 [Noviherbaspirillum agri]